MIKEYIDDALKGITEFITLSGTEQALVDIANQNINNIKIEPYINQSTICLSRYEQIFGLEVNEGKNEQFRRERLISKIRGNGTTTKELIKNVANSFTNGDVDVIENNGQYTFVIKFISIKGIPNNIDDLTRAINEAIPAHLNYNFEYKYNTWADISNMTWKEAGQYTWESLGTR